MAVTTTGAITLMALMAAATASQQGVAQHQQAGAAKEATKAQEGAQGQARQQAASERQRAERAGNKASKQQANLAAQIAEAASGPEGGDTDLTGGSIGSGLGRKSLLGE